MKLIAEKIYILCPAFIKTGGTELLHQLGYQLKKNKKCVMLVYYGKIDDQTHFVPCFDEYKIDYVFEDSIIDNNDNLLILPETAYKWINKFKFIQKVIWWLSVDNFEIHNGFWGMKKAYGYKSAFKNFCLNRLDYPWRDVKKVPYHLCQSFYAIDYLVKKGIDKLAISYLSDYINDIYFDDNIEYNRENIVLYNPGKGYEFTKKLIEYAPHIKWIAIKDMDKAEIVELMRRSKVYIDFGNHPGKDRLPREAAISGCCIITGLRGSANYEKDVCIPSYYKFKEYSSNIRNIIVCIETCFSDYKSESLKFGDYRKMIQNEKEQFIKDIETIF